MDWSSLIQRLTFGAFGAILDLHLKSEESSFWFPNVISNLGFATADRRNKRFFHYLELIRHVDGEAWDPRSIDVRVQVDVRRDYARTVATPSSGGGMLSFGGAVGWIEHFFDRLSALDSAIRGLEVLLLEHPLADESLFHNFLDKHPILLDVYGQAVSKPRFQYPTGESPLGKEYVEPDFVLRFPGNAYRLVELERPSKAMATKQGQTRSEVTQAGFQIAEWKTYIKNHYDKLKMDFPGISVSCSTMIVISRSTHENFGRGRDIAAYMQLVKQQLAVDDVLTYDDLLARSKQAYVALSSLAIESTD